MPAPYLPDPPNPQSQIEADGIYYGWIGLAANAAFRANMSLIIQNGMVAALTTPSVIAAQTLAIKNALIDVAVISANAQGITGGMSNAAVRNMYRDAMIAATVDPTSIAANEQSIFEAINDPVTLQNQTDVIADGTEQAIVDAINVLIAAKIIPSRTDIGRMAALQALASTAIRKSQFTEETTSISYADLKARMIAIDNDILN